MPSILVKSRDITTFVVKEGHGVKGLAEMGLESLPEQYIQPPEERMDTSIIVPEESIPVIDMSHWHDPKVADLICDAAEKWGFFQIVNHGVPTEVLKDVKDASHRFFNLPAEEKRKLLKENSPTNNVRFGTSFTPEAEKALEWKDYLSLFYVTDDEAAAFWPPVCKNQTLEFIQSSDLVVKKLLQVLVRRLNVTEINETKESLLMGSKRINLNYYPICPNPELTVGVGRHSDVSSLTILLQDDIGGLYVRKMVSDSWIHVSPISESLVINIGDALQIMSNGRYKSVEHRVVANGRKNRISVPIFVSPKPTDVIVKSLPSTLIFLKSSNYLQTPTMAPALDLPNSLDVTKLVVYEGHGVKGLADIGLQCLPEQYIQPPEERIDMSKVVSEESVPVIDMSQWHDQKVADSVCDAAEKWGFFQIVNHGVPIEVLEDVKEATHRFFELPAVEKRKYSKENSPTKSVRFGTSFTPEAEKALEWKDYLSLFYVTDDEASTFWPPVCKNQAQEFIRSSELVIKKLLQVLMRRLNVNEIDEQKESMLMGSKRINLNYYPICPNPELTIGVGRHSDVSTLTVLLQDDIGGLYVRKMDTDSWVHVPPISGSLVINVGDALQIMSNGRYKSIEHRVVANGSNGRISVPIFVNPRPADVIGPLAEVLESGEEPMYKQVLYSDYVRHFFSKGHDGKDTVEFAKI
ncbi:hypothetical protein RJ639_007951 [Escallonia herrerae]|uniref:Fe2OG dioxygenase domain-containing protein n=1 Tax=Escallonia herrerae TaxID=1293975 RepID=A0AA88VSU3_9ASTE|nr:hypothetical protein RJ639_007951 [Escallonia herrerae]